jgi:YggT family protein
MQILCAVLTVYMIVLFARMILSWFPPQERGSALAQISGIVYEVTEPVLAPVRRVIPPAGIFDLSFFIVVLVLGVVRGAVC